MNRWDDIAIITFIACDAVLENLNLGKNFYRYFCKKIESEAKEIVGKLSK